MLGWIRRKRRMPLLFGFDTFFGRKHRGAAGPSEPVEDDSPLAALVGERLAASQPGERAEACRHLMAMLQSSARQTPAADDGDDRRTLDICASVINDLSRSLDEGRLVFHTEPALVAYVERATHNRLKQLARAQTAALPAADSVVDRSRQKGPIPRSRPPEPATPPSPATGDVAGAVLGTVGPRHLESANPAEIQSLIEQMERLGPRLDELAELNRRSAQMAEMVGEHLRHAESRTSALDATLGRMSEESGRQTQLLETIQRHLEANGQTTARLHESLGGVREALGQLAATNTRAHEVLSELAATERPHPQPAPPGRTSRWILAALAVSGAVSLAALIVAALALW